AIAVRETLRIDLVEDRVSEPTGKPHLRHASTIDASCDPSRRRRRFAMCRARAAATCGAGNAAEWCAGTGAPPPRVQLPTTAGPAPGSGAVTSPGSCGPHAHRCELRQLRPAS